MMICPTTKSLVCRGICLMLALLISLSTFYNNSYYAVDAIAPPHPDFMPDWESVHQYRSRLAINFEYETNFLNDEICRYLNEKECKEYDIDFEVRAKATKAMVQQHGTLRVLVVPVQWQDHTEDIGKSLIPRENLDRLWNNNDVGSIANYLDVNSYGRFKIQADVVDWITTNGTEAYYADGRSGLPRPAGATPVLRWAFEYALEQLEQSGFDFSQYDEDNDGVLDSVVFLHSGYSAELGGNDCQTGTGSFNRVWSHAIGASKDAWSSTTHGIKLGAYTTTSAYRGFCQQKIARIGIMTHEFIHTLGLPDLYDRAGRYQGGSSIGGLAGYDIMANPFGQANKLNWPGHLSPWSKFDLGWVDPIEIKADGTYLAKNSETFPDIYIIRKGYWDKEYLMIENRQPLLYDREMWTGGILIYHIDNTAVLEGTNPHNKNRGFPGQANWPSNGKHYRIALLQSDGLYHLEKSANNGHADDFFVQGSYLGPGNGEAIATDDGTYPNTDSYAFGLIQVTGTSIENFQEVEPMVWSFDVRGLPIDDNAIDTPIPTESPTIRKTASPTISPSLRPSSFPSTGPSAIPSTTPSLIPSTMPSAMPSVGPTSSPSVVPSSIPSLGPSTIPSFGPSESPSNNPSNAPSQWPSVAPSTSIMKAPTRMTAVPTIAKTASPTVSPSFNLSAIPTVNKSSSPSVYPSSLPSMSPSVSSSPSSIPSDYPSLVPTNSAAPSSIPSSSPTDKPTITAQPTTEEGMSTSGFEMDPAILGQNNSSSPTSSPTSTNFPTTTPTSPTSGSQTSAAYVKSSMLYIFIGSTIALSLIVDIIFI